MLSVAARKITQSIFSIHKNITNTCTFGHRHNLLRDFICSVSVLKQKKNFSKMSQPEQNCVSPVSNVLPKENKIDNIVWVDMEMTGLDLDKDHVLEVACLVTDSQLNVIAEGPDIVIYQPPEVLSKMNDWCIKQHGESGLTTQCERSQITLKDAEKQLLDFVREWAPYKRCPLGGNTIYVDRMFLIKHMPEFEQHMHYRIIDVSSVKELCRLWYPDLYNKQPNKKEQSKHRALFDIKASIVELKFYRENIFLKGA